MGENAVVVGRSNPDPGVAMINAERGVGKVVGIRVQSSSAGRRSESFLIESA